jgi:hypothetical protein
VEAVEDTDSASANEGETLQVTNLLDIAGTWNNGGDDYIHFRETGEYYWAHGTSILTARIKGEVVGAQVEFEESLLRFDISTMCGEDVGTYQVLLIGENVLHFEVVEEP